MPWLQPHKLSVWSPCSTGGMHNDLGDSSSAKNAFASFVYQLTPSSCCSISLKFHLTSQQIHNSPLQSCPNGLLLHLDICLEELIVQNMCTYNIDMLLKKIQCRKWFFCHGFCFFLSLITKQATFFIVSFSTLSLYCNCLFTTDEVIWFEICNKVFFEHFVQFPPPSSQNAGSQLCLRFLF